MGQHADDILNGDVDQFTGEWLGDGQGYPRSAKKNKGYYKHEKIYIQHADGRVTDKDWDPKHYAKSTTVIRRELAKLIKKEKAKIPGITKKEENKIVDECRQFINTKYGKGWREQY